MDLFATIACSVQMNQFMIIHDFHKYYKVNAAKAAQQNGYSHELCRHIKWKSLPCHIIDLGQWVSCLNSLFLSFLISKMRKIIVTLNEFIHVKYLELLLA